MLKRFFFTYGTTPKHAYIGGWSEILAPNKMCACVIHNRLHGEESYESVYTEEAFSQWLRVGKRLGYGCHERIVYQRTGNHDFYRRTE